jgi:hypothetical protein
MRESNIAEFQTRFLPLSNGITISFFYSSLIVWQINYSFESWRGLGKGKDKPHPRKWVQLYSSFKLGVRWGLVVNATPRPLYPWERPGTHYIGARGGVVVKVLRYKPAGRGFDSRWCHWKFLSDNPSGRAMALGSTQPLTEISTRCISWG